MKRKAATIFTGVQRDPETNNRYFLVWADEKRQRLKFTSKPIYQQEEDAEAAAVAWVNRPQPSNFSWGQPRRRTR